jgi:hypothetical protein
MPQPVSANGCPSVVLTQLFPRIRHSDSVRETFGRGWLLVSSAGGHADYAWPWNPARSVLYPTKKSRQLTNGFTGFWEVGLDPETGRVVGLF